MAAIAGAARRIRLSEATFVVAGGMESMSNAPYIVPKARHGLRIGDGLSLTRCSTTDCGVLLIIALWAERATSNNAKLGIGRSEQDEWAAEESCPSAHRHRIWSIRR